MSDRFLLNFVACYRSPLQARKHPARIALFDRVQVASAKAEIAKRLFRGRHRAPGIVAAEEHLARRHQLQERAEGRRIAHAGGVEIEALDRRKRPSRGLVAERAAPT